jgi:hypothetical protein
VLRYNVGKFAADRAIPAATKLRDIIGRLRCNCGTRL